MVAYGLCILSALFKRYMLGGLEAQWPQRHIVEVPVGKENFYVGWFSVLAIRKNQIAILVTNSVLCKLFLHLYVPLA